jgi:hypothetical protein
MRAGSAPSIDALKQNWADASQGRQENMARVLEVGVHQHPQPSRTSFLEANPI